MFGFLKPTESGLEDAFLKTIVPFGAFVMKMTPFARNCLALFVSVVPSTIHSVVADHKAHLF
jgi:hypothetical protein